MHSLNMFTEKTLTKKNLWSEYKTTSASIATLITVLAILLARGWGAQYRVDWEETFGIGLSLTRGVSAIWEPNNYGVLSTRIMQLVIVQFPLDYLPQVIFICATMFWVANLAIIYFAIATTTENRLFTIMTVIGLALLPTPVIGGQGAIQGSWWLQTFTLMVILAAFPNLEQKRKLGIFILVFTAITVASFPVGMCLALPTMWRLMMRRSSFKKWDSYLLGAFFLGSVYQLIVFLQRDSLLSYLGEWYPNQKNEEVAVSIWSDTNALTARDLPKTSIQELPRTIYISIKSVYGEMMPDPIKSLIHADRSWFPNLLVLFLIVILSYAVVAVFARTENKRINGFVRILVFYLVPIFVFQLVTVGRLDRFQYANLFDMAFVVVVSGIVAVCIKDKNAGYIALASVMTALFVVGAVQQFRDSNRYGSGWVFGYETAKSECNLETPEEVVVIAQSTTAISNQEFSPIGLRCKHLK